nr:ABATE domain-containing protein [Actinomadura fibrosa]
MEFTFVSGHLALDFAGTVQHRRADRRDLLARPADLARWTVAAGLLTEPPPAEAADLAAAVDLREAIYRAAIARLAGTGPADADRRARPLRRRPRRVQPDRARAERRGERHRRIVHRNRFRARQQPDGTGVDRLGQHGQGLRRVPQQHPEVPAPARRRPSERRGVDEPEHVHREVHRPPEQIGAPLRYRRPLHRVHRTPRFPGAPHPTNRPTPRRPESNRPRPGRFRAGGRRLS